MAAPRSSSSLQHFANDLESLAYAAARQHLAVPEVVLPADVNVVLRGMRFHYLDWGDQQKRPMLFLHGGGLNAHTYDLVCLALRADYHCISLDQRGHGDSEWSPVMDYDTATHAADVEALVDYLGLDRLILVGMSMGGLNALHYAGDHARRLAALVIIDSGPDMQSSGSQRIRDFLSEPNEAESIDDFIDRAVAFNARRDPLLLRRSLLHNLRRTPDGKWVWKWDPRPRRRSDPHRLARRRDVLWTKVPGITCPTLLVRGAESDVFSEEDASELARRLPNARHVTIESAGHTVQGDNPAALVREMRSFFSSIGVWRVPRQTEVPAAD